MPKLKARQTRTASLLHTCLLALTLLLWLAPVFSLADPRPVVVRAYLSGCHGTAELHWGVQYADGSIPSGTVMSYGDSVTITFWPLYRGDSDSSAREREVRIICRDTGWGRTNSSVLLRVWELDSARVRVPALCPHMPPVRLTLKGGKP